MSRSTRNNTPAVVTKVCPRLRALGVTPFEFPATTEFFYKDSSTKDGLAVWSKVAERDYNRGYNARRALRDAIATRDAIDNKKSAEYKSAHAIVVECENKVAEIESDARTRLTGRVARTFASAAPVVADDNATPATKTRKSRKSVAA